jgi:hypothetical protein
MWAFLDFVARLILAGGVALLGWWLYQILREPSARGCIACGSQLYSGELVTCSDCLGVN